MKRLVVIILLGIGIITNAQNLELTNGKDIRQPGKVNPSLAGVQEDLIRVLTDAEIGESYQLMLEGKIPFKLGNYMVGVERTFTDDVTNNMFNLTYARKSKKTRKEKIQWRYGGTFQFHTRELTTPGFDSTSGYTFRDINGEIKSVKNIEDLKSSINYVNLVLGGSVNYNNLIAGVSLENFFGSDVSLTTVESRKLPFTTNFIVGGFFPLGKATLFPSAVVVLNDQDFYAKASLDYTAEKFNVAAGFINENDRRDLTASIALKGKKVFAGIKYTHPLSQNSNAIIEDLVPTFSLFFNSTVFKSRNLFKSDFAKQMKKIY